MTDWWLIILIAAVSFAVSAFTGMFLIPYLRKLHFGQTILEIGPKWHKSKQGTPIMGGFMFIVGSILAAASGYTVYRSRWLDLTSEETSKAALTVLACVVFSLLFSAIGFGDDYIKAVKKRNLGLNAKQKMLLQFIFSAAFLGTLYTLGYTDTSIDLMFVRLNFGMFYYPVMILFIIFISNAVNLTDGVDGLCGTVTFVSMMAATAVCSFIKLNELSFFTVAVAGGCLGFLVWNLHPAKCFMGDTGSMYLGGAFAAVSIVTGKHILMALIGIVYVFEALSVILQVISFKTTGKRIFKMSPVHHHFEITGYSEYKIVIVFSLIGLVSGTLAVLSLL